MIQPEQFKDIQNRILASYGNDFPKAPESLFLSRKTDENINTSSIHIFIQKGGEMVRKVVDIGKTAANSELVGEVMKSNLLTQAAAGAAVGAGIAIMIPYSIVGLGTGAAVGASLAGWKYITK